MRRYRTLTRSAAWLAVVTLLFSACAAENAEENQGETTKPPVPESVATVADTTTSPSPTLPPEETGTTPTTPPEETEPPTSVPEQYDDYFRGSLFVGDSVMEGLAQYVRAQRRAGVEMLSDAAFLTTTVGITVADIVGEPIGDRERFYFAWRGVEQPLETILGQANVNRVFLMLGMNDLAQGASVEQTVERYRAMLALLTEANPNIELIVLPVTPKTASAWLPSYCLNPDFGSPILNTLAEQITALCSEADVGIKTIDVNTAVRDENGNLPDAYSRDGYVHINDTCSAVIVETLREFARLQMEAEA